MDHHDKTSMQVLLFAGAGIVSCLGIREGESLIPPLKVEESIETDDLSHLSIRCHVDASISSNPIQIDLRASEDSHSLSLSVLASRPSPSARITLLDSDYSVKRSLPLNANVVSLGKIESDAYSIVLEAPGIAPQSFGITLEPISVPAGIDAGMQCFCHKRFLSALTIFQRLLSIYPESGTLSDLITLTRTFLIQANLSAHAGVNRDVWRSIQSGSGSTEDLTNGARTPRSEEFSRILSASANLTETEWGQLMVAQASRFSIATTTALRIARSEIIAALRPELQSLAERVDRIDALSSELQDSQRQLAASVTRVETFVTRDYTPYIYSALGPGCAQWLGNPIISDIASAEENYRGAMNAWVANEPNFKVPLFSISGALEVVIRRNFDATFNHVRNALAKPAIADYVRSKFGDRDSDIEKTMSRPFTLGQADKLITRGNAIVSQWGKDIPKPAADLLGKLDRPDLTNPLIRLFELRNSIAHHKRTFTAYEMLLARKLVLGIDELKIQRDWRSFPSLEQSGKLANHANKHRPNQYHTWNDYPGILQVLWGIAH